LKHIAAAFGLFGGAYQDHVKHLWSESLTPDLLPLTDDPLYQEIVNFTRNLQYDRLIRRINDPGSFPIGPKLFQGTAEDRAAFEQRIRWKENDPRLQWTTKPPPFCGNGPDGFVVSAERLSNGGSLPARGGHGGSGRNASKGVASRYSARHVGEHGAGGQHDDYGDYDHSGADADDRDHDHFAADGHRVGRGVLDESRSKVGVCLSVCTHLLLVPEHRRESGPERM
jgi:hypothetical protein